MAVESLQLIRDTIAECNRLSRLAAHVEIAKKHFNFNLATQYVFTEPDGDLYQAAGVVHELTRQLLEGSGQLRFDD